MSAAYGRRICNQEQELSEEEQYRTDTHYEKERLTDTYNEYFEDDENKADSFTDGNAYRETLEINHTLNKSR
jgi:hypothetical protein